ncbi:hypothetical protein ACWIUD_09745 [Helicobacter sp. 23-1044]
MRADSALFGDRFCEKCDFGVGDSANFGVRFCEKCARFCEKCDFGVGDSAKNAILAWQILRILREKRRICFYFFIDSALLAIFRAIRRI